MFAATRWAEDYATGRAEVEELAAEPVEPTFVIRPGERLTRTIAMDAEMFT